MGSVIVLGLEHQIDVGAVHEIRVADFELEEESQTLNVIQMYTNVVHKIEPASLAYDVPVVCGTPVPCQDSRYTPASSGPRVIQFLGFDPRPEAKTVPERIRRLRQDLESGTLPICASMPGS